jgi:uncharacterized protein (DUF305 family)
MEHQNHHYRHLSMMAVLSFLMMYILMYAMANSVSNAYSNINQLYMAGLMTAPMVIIELFVMRGMYTDKRRNAIIMAVSVVAGVVFFAGIRQQVGVGDSQFLRSMIPHHASAILMCGQAPIDAPDIKRLCASIIMSQQAEIDQMKAMLARR